MQTMNRVMRTLAKQSSGGARARPTDDFVPGIAHVAPGRKRAAAVLGCAVLAPLVLAVTPTSDAVRRIVYLVALVLLWTFIVRAVAVQTVTGPRDGVES